MLYKWNGQYKEHFGFYRIDWKLHLKQVVENAPQNLIAIVWCIKVAFYCVCLPSTDGKKAWVYVYLYGSIKSRDAFDGQCL